MSAASTTRALALTAGCLLLVDLALHWPASDAQSFQRSPALEQPTRVRLSQGDDEVILAQQDGRWRIMQDEPVDADAALIAQLLAPVVGGVDLGVAHDQGRLDEYTLDGHEAVHITIDDADGDRLDLWVGANTAGGQSWLRRDGEQTVYRADVGGRTRWTSSAASLRDRSLLNLAESDVQGLAVRRGALTATAVRSELGWRLKEDPALALDPMVLDQLVATLSHWSGARVVDDGSDPIGAPALEVTLTTDTEHPIALHNLRGTWVAQRPGGPRVTIDPTLLQALARPELMWRERRLLTTPPTQLREVSIRSPAGSVSWVLGDQGWVRAAAGAEPAPADLDRALAMLASARMVGWLDSSEQPALPIQLSVVAADGERSVIAVDLDEASAAIPARSSATGARTGTIDATTAAVMRSLAGRIE